MTDMTIANEILRQLGGRRFTMMTGAKNYVGGDNYLQFDIGRNSSKANKVRITLEPNDTYKVEFMRYNARSFDVTTLHTLHGIYYDMLRDDFTNYTGLHTSL